MNSQISVLMIAVVLASSTAHAATKEGAKIPAATELILRGARVMDAAAK